MKITIQESARGEFDIPLVDAQIHRIAEAIEKARNPRVRRVDTERFMVAATAELSGQLGGLFRSRMKRMMVEVDAKIDQIYAQIPDKARDVRAYLADNAGQFGISAEAVRAMKNPVVVRVVDGVDKADMKKLVRQFNETFTQGMDPRTLQVALAGKINDKVLSSLASITREDDTLNSALSRRDSKVFIRSMESAGILDNRNRSQYVSAKTGMLNEDGKDFVERILVGHIIPSGDILAEMPRSMLNTVSRAIPYLAAAKASNPKYDLSGPLKVAVDAKIHLNQTGKKLHDYLHQGTDMFTGEAEPELARNKAARIIYGLLDEDKPLKTARVFREYAAQAKANPAGQAGLFGSSQKSPEQLLAGLTGSMVTKAAPTGGKYIKRVPYVDSTGKKRYHYYYTKDAAAHGKEGRVHAGDSKILSSKQLNEIPAIKAGKEYFVMSGGNQYSMEGRQVRPFYMADKLYYTVGVKGKTLVVDKETGKPRASADSHEGAILQLQDKLAGAGKKKQEMTSEEQKRRVERLTQPNKKEDAETKRLAEQKRRVERLTVPRDKPGPSPVDKETTAGQVREGDAELTGKKTTINRKKARAELTGKRQGTDNDFIISAGKREPLKGKTFRDMMHYSAGRMLRIVSSSGGKGYDIHDKESGVKLGFGGNSLAAVVENISNTYSRDGDIKIRRQVADGLRKLQE